MTVNQNKDIIPPPFIRVAKSECLLRPLLDKAERNKYHRVGMWMSTIISVDGHWPPKHQPASNP